MSQPTRACPTCHTPLPGVAAFCYVCGSATPPGGLNRETGEMVAVSGVGMSPAELRKKLQRALGPGYELGVRIGAGGFAEVFKARDLRLKRDLAIKVLRPELGLTPGMVERFRREAETIATLRHPNIVPIYDVGEGDGLAFLIMPFIGGESLRAYIDREGAMPVADVRRILREAASGLAAAHEMGVIHRDIKPENIMLEGRDHRVLLMDFGIAKAVGGSDEDQGDALTTTGIIIGTPQYMSPEQACGDKSIDARSDQYSLAVVGYRMISGQLPFEGDSTRAMLYQQLVSDPAPLASKVPDVPPGLDEAIQRAMAKEPAERFDSMHEFMAMVDAERSATFSQISTPAPRASRRVGMPVTIAAGVALLAAVAFAASRQGRAAPPTDALQVAGDTTSAATDTNPAAALPPGTADGKPATTAPTPGTTVRTPARTTATTADGGRRGSTTGGAPATVSCARASGASDWPAAASACEAEASNGSATAQRILGTMYDKGLGVGEDPARAVEWYRKAAATDFEAKFLLAKLVELGRGTYQSESESVAMMREAAAGGHLRAQQTLAFRLENGAGIRKDESEALVWYRRAAAQDDAAAQTKVGEFLARGRGTQKNESEAVLWFEKAANNGSTEGAWQAAQAYLRGRGVNKDETSGMEWLRKAAAKNHPEAVKELQKREG
ncbi:MAG: SEL1-like repeat protein [Gemmatimonadales bacterium]|nr:SEL1-like repeat protein [Gemmatimonadales bacterium]